MPKYPTVRQAETSRSNGARSKGPSSANGKERACRNALSHGLTSTVVVLANERQEEFDRLLASYVDFWKPVTQPEVDLVHDIVAARWRLARALTFEAAAMNIEMDRMRPDLDVSIIGLDEPARATLAYSSLVDNGKTIAMLSRHEARLRRSIARSVEQLTELRRRRGENGPEINFQIEPDATPVSERTPDNIDDTDI